MPKDLEMYQDLLAEIMIDFSVAKGLVILPINSLRRTILQAKYNTEKKEFLSTKNVPICMKRLRKKGRI